MSWLLQELFISFLLLVFTFVIRLPFILVPCHDESGTWWITVKQQGKSLHYDVSDSLIQGYFGYPRLQYYLLSWFPEKLWRLLGYLSNLAYDCLSVLVVYVISSILLSEHLSVYTGASTSFGARPALWVAVLFATTPALLPVTARLTGIKARTFGGLLCLLYFVSFGGAYIGGISYLYPVTISLGILIILASAFALQSIVFFSLLLTLFYLDWIPAAVVLATLVVGLAIPKIGVLKVLKFKLNHYLWWIQTSTKPIIDRRNRLQDLLLVPKYIFTRPQRLLTLLFHHNSFIIVLYFVPGLFLLAYWLLVNEEENQVLLSNDVAFYALMIVLGSVVVFIITSLKPFRFLGEAERYFEYSSPFLSYLLVLYIVGNEFSSLHLLGLLIVHLCTIGATFCFLLRKELGAVLQPPLVSGDSQGLLEYLNRCDQPLNILTMPMKLSYALSARIRNPSTRFYYMWMDSGEDGFGYMTRDSEEYNWPRTDLCSFRRKYGVNTVVVEKNRVVRPRMQKYKYAVEQLECMYENAEYAVYRM